MEDAHKAELSEVDEEQPGCKPKAQDGPEEAA